VEAIQKEVAREVARLLEVIFQDRRKSGHLDLEAIEMAMRSAMHQAGAAALSKLLQWDAPAGEQRSIACSCGQQALYRQLRSKPVLSVVGQVEVLRPYYLCGNCHTGQFPADAELDIQGTAFSPGVRRMQALVGQEAPFDHGRQQMRLLAGLEVTTKAVERTAEAIGEDIARGEQQHIQRAVQLHLPIVVGEPIPILYVQMDGTGVPVVKKETLGRKGKTDGQPAHTREVKLGCVFTQTHWDPQGYAIPLPPPTPAPSKPPRSLANACTWKLGIEVGAARNRRLLWATERNGSGIWPSNTFPAPSRSWICITPANTCGT